MDARTHLGLDPTLSGRPVLIDEGHATVELITTSTMAADDRGLVHGGFVFSAVEHAAMLAVNDPHVVLSGTLTCFVLDQHVLDGRTA